MHLRSFVLGGAIALGANAFFVPEGALPPKTDVIDVRPVEAHIAHQQQVDLACTECPFREEGDNGKVSWTDGFETSLLLNFSIEDGYLLANGQQIFPPPPATRIHAVQHRLSDGEASKPIPLGYALEMMPVPTPPDAHGFEILSVRFTVLDLDGHPVPLDTVVLTLIHNLEGSLFIAKTDLEKTTGNDASWKQCSGKPNCLRRLLFDRMSALLASAKDRMMRMGSKLSGKGGCHRKVGMHPFPRPHHHKFGPGGVPGPNGHLFGVEDQPEHGGRPHHRRPHHWHHGGLERTVSRVVRFIVIPAVLGVLAGLAASALGMLVGQVVVFLWLRYRRSGSRQSAVQIERGTVSEKEGLMVESSEEIPPEYSDELPEYHPDTKN